jgi:DNA-binding transcriptional LysR family regulator
MTSVQWIIRIESIHQMNLSSFDLNLLVALEALLAERSVSRAATRVGLSQPAMSNALSRLRTVFRDPLLVRTGRSMALTARGERLILPLRAAIAQIKEVIGEKARFVPATSTQSFSIAATDYWGFVFLPELVRVLEIESPRIVLEIKRLVGGQFEPPIAELRAGAFDVAIGFFPEVPATSPDIYRKQLCTDKLVSIAATTNRRVGKTLTLRRYLELGHVATKYRERGGQATVDSALERMGHSRSVKLIVPHYFEVPLVVSYTDLIGNVPAKMARKFSASLPIKLFRPPVEVQPFNTIMLWHERTESDPAQAWFRNMLIRCSQSSA